MKTILAIIVTPFLCSTVYAHTVNNTICDKTVIGVYHQFKTMFAPGTHFPIGDGGAIKASAINSTELFYTFKERWANYICTSTFKVNMEKGTKILKINWRVIDLENGKVAMPDNLQIHGAAE